MNSNITSKIYELDRFPLPFGEKSAIAPKYNTMVFAAPCSEITRLFAKSFLLYGVRLFL